MTHEDKEWTKKYHDSDPKKKCFGGRVLITMDDGTTLDQELGIADAHPNGKRPFKRPNYIQKFKTLTDGIISQAESERFLSQVQNLPNLKAGELHSLNIEVNSDLQNKKRAVSSIFG